MKALLKNYLPVVTAIFVVAAPLYSQNVSITASVDRTRIGLNEDFTLVVEVAGDAGEPKLPDMNAFAALAGTSSSQNIQIINGRFSSSRTYQYTFLARTAGKFTINPVEVEVKGQVYRSQPIEIEIVAGGTSPQTPPGGAGAGRRQQTEPPPPDLAGNLYLEAKVDRARVFQNEPVIVRYKIYTRLNLTSYGISNLPNYSGFWAEDFPMPQQPQTHREVINGLTYLVAEIKKTALFPQSVGRKKLEPLVIECEVQLPRRRSRDLFEDFFNDPFFARTTRQSISSRPVEIEVLPLPEEGRPVNFSGAVGSFSIAASVDRAQVKTNEAITLKVRASGTGNIKVLPQPKIDLPSDFEVYAPKVTENLNHDNNQISGSKTWEYVIVPRFEGSHEIKPIPLSYFDPRARTYRTVATAAIPLIVERGAGDYTTVPGSGFSKEDVRLLGKDIRFISKAALPFRKVNEVIYTQPLFLTAMIAPLLALLIAFVYERHQEKLSTNIAYARSRKAGSVAQKQLRTAKKFLQKNDGKAFYAEVQRALMGFLGNKLNVAEAGLITDEVERMLTEKQVSPEVVRAYLDCLHTCDFQRFAPAQTNAREMQEFYEQARRAIEAMEKAL
ncbi:MAG: BatD family protein [candidate division KSB1 bacterium]|nr:BatD family protein [candidate division KSB1 bacterium]MDZ7304832.1 BatD family protein [candidate division KSB1 bacterium]MDZ7313912.1 BatD family protein [candidate division KSB1 bacterium]